MRKTGCAYVHGVYRRSTQQTSVMMMVDAQKHSFGHIYTHINTHKHIPRIKCDEARKNMDVSQLEPCEDALYKWIEFKADAKCFKGFRIVQLWCFFRYFTYSGFYSL